MHGDDFLQVTLPAMDMVHNLARRLLKDEHAAEDLVQETYLAAYAAWIKRRRPDRVEAWMATICLNLARSQFRRVKHRPIEVIHPEPGTTASSASDTADEALTLLERNAVRRAVWKLPDEQRIAITLVDLAGLTAAEAAKAMGTPRGTVLSRVHRGRKALASLVREEVEIREP